jgi:RNA polymerase sigma-54 factor
MPGPSDVTAASPAPARGVNALSDRSARAALIGKIVLARFLERPLPAVIVAVQAAEAVAQRYRLFHGRNAPLRCRRLDGAEIQAGAPHAEALGSVCVKAGQPVVRLYSVYSTYEYLLNRSRLAACLEPLSDADRVRVLRAVRTLLLLTTRNRLTLEVCRIVLEVQHRFLRTVNEAEMVPLTGCAVAQEAQRRGVTAADAGRVSRILRSTVVVLPDGSTWPLRRLCPTSRTVLRAHVRRVLEIERRLRARGRLERAWSDAAIAERLARRTGIPVSQRLVSYCRQTLGAPGVRVRTARGGYMAATMNFSRLAPLERPAVVERAPAAPGVYELRLSRGEPDYTPACAGVIYIGRATDLRRRLLAHASGNGRNAELARHIAGSRVLFRFRVETGDITHAESALFRQFCETYGRPPACNRVHP